MVIAIDPAQPFDFVLPEEASLPPEEQTKWKLRGLTARERAYIDDNIAATRDEVTSYRVGSTKTDVLRFGLLGFERFCYADGRAVPYVQGRDPLGGTGAADAVLDVIPPDVARQLADAITERGQVSEADSDSSARQSSEAGDSESQTAASA